MQLADRHNTGKLQWSLVDFPSLEGMVRVLEKGALKYSRDNWKRGHPNTDLCESLMRHLFAYMSGEDVDPESGDTHIGHMQCNLMFLGYNAKHHPELDTRYREPLKQAA